MSVPQENRMADDDNARRLIATTKQRYNGKWIVEGEEFEALTEEDVSDLVTMRFAVRASGAMGSRAGGYLRRDMRAERPARKAKA
jgi:hypothetical protein